MPTAPFVAGPIAIFVGLDANPSFLGWSERGVSTRFQRSYVDYHVDLGGTTAADKSYQGAIATVSFDLTRWDQAVLTRMENISERTLLAGNAGGIDVAGSIGTLMAHEGAAYPMWLRYPYSVSPAYSTMIPGIHWYKAFINDEDFPEHGAKPSKIHLVMQCIRELDMSAAGQNIFGAGRWKLYDHDMSGIAGVQLG